MEVSQPLRVAEPLHWSGSHSDNSLILVWGQVHEQLREIELGTDMAPGQVLVVWR